MTRLIVVAAAAIGLMLFVAFVASRLVQSQRRGISIRMQIFFALAAIVGAFAFGLGVMVVDRIEARASRVALEAAAGEAELVAQLIASEISRFDLSLERVGSHFEDQRKRGGTMPLELRDARGVLIFAQPSLPADLELVSSEAPIRVDDRVLGSVRVFKETVRLRELIADFAPTVLVISLVLGAAAALAAAWIGGAIARPLEQLTSYSERVSSGQGDAAPEVPYGKEVSRLAHSIDWMRRQLQGRPFVETFAADLSHELKNPVAAIRASAEILHDGALDEPVQAKHFVSRIREATERIEQLLKELLNLAHIEARGVEQLDRIDLKDLVTQVVSVSRDPTRVRYEGLESTWVRGNRAWLQRAIGNLIENGLIHGESTGIVRIAIVKTAEHAAICVRNPGSVAEHVRKNAFGRFVTTRRDKGGSGLGLAIVRAVAEAHGGGVTLAAGGPPEVEFRLSLPLALVGIKSIVPIT